MGTRNPGGGGVRDSYLDLVKRLPLRPIRSERGLDRALPVLEDLISRKHLDAGERDYLDVLSDLVEQYEAKHHAIDTEGLTDAEMLRHLMEAKNVTQADVSRETGIAAQTLSEFLSGKRTIPRFRIGALARYFHVSPAVFAFGRA